MAFPRVVQGVVGWMTRIPAMVIGGAIALGAWLLATAIIGLLVAIPVLLLWNWTMPGLLGAARINYWESLALYLLCHLLLRSRSHRPEPRAPVAAREG